MLLPSLQLQAWRIAVCEIVALMLMDCAWHIKSPRTVNFEVCRRTSVLHN